MGGYISILLLIAIAATCHGQINKCKSYCVQLCRHNDWPRGGMCCAGNGRDRGEWNGCRHGECDLFNLGHEYVPVLKSILRISGIIHMSIKKIIHMLYVLNLFFVVVAPNTNAAIWGRNVGIPQCIHGEEELLEDSGHALGPWMTAWRCAPPIRWVDSGYCYWKIMHLKFLKQFQAQTFKACVTTCSRRCNKK